MHTIRVAWLSIAAALCVTLHNVWPSTIEGSTNAMSQIVDQVLAELKFPTPATLAGGKGPIDMDYRLEVFLMQLRANKLPAREVETFSGIPAAVSAGDYAKGRLALDLVAVVRFLNGDEMSSERVEELLLSPFVSIRCNAAYVAGHFHLSELVPQLQTMAKSDPYVRVGRDDRGRVAFTTPVREEAATALQQLGVVGAKPVPVSDGEGLLWLKRLYGSAPEMRNDIEQILKSFLGIASKKEAFRNAMRLLRNDDDEADSPGAQEFVRLCHRLAATYNTERYESTSWPKDPQGNDLPPPPRVP